MTAALGGEKYREAAAITEQPAQKLPPSLRRPFARDTPTQQFKEEVEKYLTGNSEPSELIYFKVYKASRRSSPLRTIAGWRRLQGVS